MNTPASPNPTPAPSTEASSSQVWLARWTGRGSAPTDRAEYVAQRQVISTHVVGSLPSAISAQVGRTGPTGR